jgi:hypothetical protein
MLLQTASDIFLVTTLNGPHTKHNLLLEGVFTVLLHSNGSCSVVACIFVAVGMCLQSCCLTTDVSSDFTVPDFGRHVAILLVPQSVTYYVGLYHYYRLLKLDTENCTENCKPIQIFIKIELKLLIFYMKTYIFFTRFFTTLRA